MFDEDYAHQMQINDLSHTLCTQSKRRKSSIPSKCGLQYVSTNSSDGNEPINLTQKPPLSSRLTNEPEYGPVALKLSEIAGQYNQCSNDTIASSSKFPTNLPFSSIFPMNQTLFPFYKYNREAGNSALIGSVSSPTPMTVSHITDPSSTLDLSKTPPTILRESNGVLQMIKSCLEQIPMPPFGTGCHEPLTLLYSQAMFQAINFQKSVHAYLAELNIKNQQESKGSLNTPLLTPDHTASKVSEMKSPPETESAIDLRLRPDTHIFHRNRRDIEAVFTSFHQTNSAQKVEEDCPNCIQSQNSFYSTSIIQRSPPLTTFSASSLCSAFTSRLPSSSSFSSLSRTSSRSTPSYICGRRCKAVGLKSQKHRSFGGHTTPSSFLGGGAHASSSMHHKKTSFRGTSEEENEVCLKFRPTEHQGHIILSDLHPSVRLPNEVYQSLIIKSSGSATRLIRLLMKSFFSQEELAASSLSGEGIYKQRLQPDITEAIKVYIRKRHPQLKTGSINLCMTDVCVQARRVANNQRSRVRGAQSKGTPSTSKFLTSASQAFWGPLKSTSSPLSTSPISQTAAASFGARNLIFGATGLAASSPMDCKSTPGICLNDETPNPLATL